MKVKYPELSLGNAKTGPSFSLPEGITCPGQTTTCSLLCYVKHGRMALPVSKDKRARNLRACIDGLKISALLLAKRIASVIDNAAVDTLRIHDSGDFFSPKYTQAWIHAVQRTKWVQYWAYTRSFTVDSILPELAELAKEENMSLWLSADVDNYMQALITLREYPQFKGIAFLQSEDSEEIALIVQKAVGKLRFINFPAHGAFGRKHVDISNELRNCPAVTGAIKADKKSPACLQCKLCL